MRLPSSAPSQHVRADAALATGVRYGYAETCVAVAPVATDAITIIAAAPTRARRCGLATGVRYGYAETCVAVAPVATDAFIIIAAAATLARRCRLSPARGQWSGWYPSSVPVPGCPDKRDDRRAGSSARAGARAQGRACTAALLGMVIASVATGATATPGVSSRRERYGSAIWETAAARA